MILSTEYIYIRKASTERPPPSEGYAKKLLKELSNVPKNLKFAEFHQGLGVEREHDDVTHGHMKEVGKIVLDHLRENPDYYTRLKKAMN